MLVGTTVVGSVGVDAYFWVGEDVKTWRFYVIYVSLSSVFIFFLVGLLLVGFNCGLDYEEMLIRLVIHLDTPF